MSFLKKAFEEHKKSMSLFLDTTPPNHLMCTCSAIPYREPTRTELDDIGAKAAAMILLADQLSGLVIPDREEWIGFNLLERDDEMPKERA